MSRHQEWKMMHLLYRRSHTSSDGLRKVLTEDELRRAGVHCETDTWIELRHAGLVDWVGGEWEQTDVRLPADFGGVHYNEYDLADLASGALLLTSALEQWARHVDHRPFGVRELEDR